MSRFRRSTAITALQIKEALAEFQRWGVLPPRRLSLRWPGRALERAPPCGRNAIPAEWGRGKSAGDSSGEQGSFTRGGPQLRVHATSCGSCPTAARTSRKLPSQSPGNRSPPVPPSITADAVGLLAALRVEVPVEPDLRGFRRRGYSAAADVDQSVPGAVVTGSLVLTIALRDHLRKHTTARRDSGRRLQLMNVAGEKGERGHPALPRARRPPWRAVPLRSKVNPPWSPKTNRRVRG